MNRINVVILYSGFKKHGATATLASYIENGIKQSNNLSNIAKYNVNYITKSDIPNILNRVKNCNLLIMGTGTYNGNIEDELLDFVNTNFKSGKDSNAINLQNVACGQFATSAYYGTGAQNVLNSLSRLMMTFGGNIISGPNWRISQGVIGIADNPNKSDPNQWEWNKNFSVYLQDNAESYGKRLISIGTIFQKLRDNYTMINTGLSTSKSDNYTMINTGLSTSKSDNSTMINISIIITLIVLILLFCLAIYLWTKK